MAEATKRRSDGATKGWWSVIREDFGPLDLRPATADLRCARLATLASKLTVAAVTTCDSPADTPGDDEATKRRSDEATKGGSRHGLSIIETLIALAISALLLTATMVAIDASFRAYADTAATASTQTATRLITNRFMSMLRTSTAHGPLVPDPGSNPPVTLSGNTLTSNYVELVDSRNNLVRLEYRSVDEELWVTSTPLGGGQAIAQPLLSGVSNCQFFVNRRLDSNNVWVLERATMDLTVDAPPDATLSIENGAPQPIRMIASTMPRQLQ